MRDAALEIFARVIAPFLPRLAPAVEARVILGKIFQNSDLRRAKSSFGNPEELPADPCKIGAKLFPRQCKRAQIQIQKEVKVIGKAVIMSNFSRCLKVASGGHDHVMDGTRLIAAQERVALKEGGAVTDILRIQSRRSPGLARLMHGIVPECSKRNEVRPGRKMRKRAELFEQAADMLPCMIGAVIFPIGSVKHVPSAWFVPMLELLPISNDDAPICAFPRRRDAVGHAALVLLSEEVIEDMQKQ